MPGRSSKIELTRLERQMSEYVETWGDFKKVMEDAGISDDTKMAGIDVNFNCLTSVDLQKGHEDRVMVFDGEYDGNN